MTWEWKPWTIDDWAAWWDIAKIPMCAAAIILFLGWIGHKRNQEIEEIRENELARRRALPYDPNDLSLRARIPRQPEVYYNWFEYKGKYYGEGTIVKVIPEFPNGYFVNIMKNIGCYEDRLFRFSHLRADNLTYLELMVPKEDGKLEVYRPKYLRHNKNSVYWCYINLVPEHFIEEIVYPIEIPKEQAREDKGRTAAEREKRNRHLPIFSPLILGAVVCLFGAVFNMLTPVAVLVLVLLVLYYCYMFYS